jgi:hypothetical protein
MFCSLHCGAVHVARVQRKARAAGDTGGVHESGVSGSTMSLAGFVEARVRV